MKSRNTFISLRSTYFVGTILLILIIISSLLSVTLPINTTFADGEDVSLDFVAVAPHVYDHNIGGGAFNDGSKGEDLDVREELEATDFNYGDIVTFLTKVTVNELDDINELAIQVDYEFYCDPTGQPGAAYIEVTNVAINYGQVENGDDGTGVNPGAGSYGLDGAINDDRQIPTFDSGIGGSSTWYTWGIYPTGSKVFGTPRAEHIFLTVNVDNLESDEVVVVRVDMRIVHEPGSNPTGNLHAILKNGYVIEEDGIPLDTPDSIPGGNQTIPFKKVSEFGLPSNPQYSIDKTITGVDVAGNGIIDNAGEIIDYQITVTNDGDVNLTGVSVSDPLLQGANGILSGPTESMTVNGILEVGEIWDYTGSYTVQQSDFDNNGGGDGDIDNTATVSSNELGEATDSAAQVIMVSKPPTGGGFGGGMGGGLLPSYCTSVTATIDDLGIFTEEVITESEDGNLRMIIPKGTSGLQEFGAKLVLVCIPESAYPPDAPENTELVSAVYDLTPDGASFDPPITLCFTYDPELIPEGVDPANLVVAMRDDNLDVWVELPDGAVNTEAHTICVAVSHFTPFAVIAHTDPASFTIDNLISSPSKVEIGDPITISANVTNTGDLSSSYEVSLFIDGELAETKQVTLIGGVSQTVSFSVTEDTAGTYSVEVNDLTGSFTVVELPPPPPIQAVFSVADLALSANEVITGETVTVSVLVSNTGELSGNYNILLRLGDQVIDSRQITLDGGRSQIATFATTPEEAGSYIVEVNGLTSRLLVTTAPVPPPSPTYNWWLIGGIVGGSIAAIAVTTFLILVHRMDINRRSNT